MKILNLFLKRSWATQTAPDSDSTATRYSITHEIGGPQKLTLWGAGQSLTIELPDDTAMHLSSSLTSGVIDNRRLKRRGR